MTDERYMVLTDRADGSRTYTGPLPMADAVRERAARDAIGPGYRSRILTMRESATDVAAWERTIDGPFSRYVPDPFTDTAAFIDPSRRKRPTVGRYAMTRVGWARIDRVHGHGEALTVWTPTHGVERVERAATGHWTVTR